MPDAGITIHDGYMATYIDENGHLKYEHDILIDNVDFSLNQTNGHLNEIDEVV